MLSEENFSFGKERFDMILCPTCRIQMQQHQARGHYGASLIMFQCPSCAGLWLDGRVARGMSYDSALETDGDSDFEEIIMEPRKTNLVCPGCESMLMEQSGGGLPAGLHIDFCAVCEGYWFDKGELMIYKSYLEKKRQKTRRDEEQLRRKKESTGWPRPEKKEDHSWHYTGLRVMSRLARDLSEFIIS